MAGTPNFRAGWDRFFAAIQAEEIAKQRKLVAKTHTDDGDLRSDRLMGPIPDRAVAVTTADGIETTEPSSVSLADSLADQLQDIAESIVDATPVGVDTTSVNLTTTPTITGTEIEADLIFAGTGGLLGTDGRAARSDHTHHLAATATLDFTSIAAQTCQDMTITVTGAVVGDAVVLAAPAGIESGLTWSGRVSAANTVTIRLCNVTASPVDPASADWSALVFAI